MKRSISAHRPEVLEANRLAHLGKITSEETKLKQSEAHKQRLREHPELVPYRIVARKHHEQGTEGYVSKKQNILFGLVKGVFPDAVMELPVDTGKTMRYMDVAVPSQRLDFEYNSSLHKKFVSEHRESKRDAEIQGIGWSVVHVDDFLLKMMQKGANLL